MGATSWSGWKKSLYAWEESTARYLEQVLRSPMLVAPAGVWLRALSIAKTTAERGAAAWWSGVGLPTRADQERLAHAVNEMQSRLLDLEERLAEAAPMRAEL